MNFWKKWFYNSLYDQYTRKSIPILVAFFLLFGNVSYAQEADYNYANEYRSWLRKNRDSAMIFCDKLMKSKDINQQLFGLGGKSYVYVLRANYPEADRYLMQAFQKLEATQDSNMKAWMYYFKTQRHLDSHDLKEAIDAAIEGLNQCGGKCSDF